MKSIHLKKAVSGDVSALNHLLNQHKDIAFSIAFRILQNKDNAEDAVQDAFIRVFKYIRKFRNDSQFSTWLYRIVYNECMRVKKEYSQMHFSNVDGDDKVIDYPVIDDALEKLVESDRKRIIREALDTLHPNESLVLTLFYLEDKTIKDIHIITQLSKSNIKVILFRARKNLNKILNRMFNYEKEPIV
ncbi:RNA polymerase sigma factor [Candidatus Latescibacterota bacterium]